MTSALLQDTNLSFSTGIKCYPSSTNFYLSLFLWTSWSCESERCLVGLTGFYSRRIYITLSLKNNNYNYQLHLTLSFTWSSEMFNYEVSQFPFISEINRHYWERDHRGTSYEPTNCWNYVPENHWSALWKWTKQSAKSYGRKCRRNSWISKLKISPETYIRLLWRDERTSHGTNWRIYGRIITPSTFQKNSGDAHEAETCSMVLPWAEECVFQPTVRKIPFLSDVHFIYV
jgi:hypothetical protein